MLDYFLSQSIEDAIVAFIISIFTLTLASIKYRKEQWWTKQSAAYSELVGALVELRQSLSFVSAMYKNNGLAERELALHVAMHRANEAVKQLEKSLNKAGFLLSKEVVPVIQEIYKAHANLPYTKIIALHRADRPVEEVHAIIKPLYVLISEQNDKIKAVSRGRIGIE